MGVCWCVWVLVGACGRVCESVCECGCGCVTVRSSYRAVPLPLVRPSVVACPLASSSPPCAPPPPVPSYSQRRSRACMYVRAWVHECVGAVWVRAWVRAWVNGCVRVCVRVRVCVYTKLVRGAYIICQIRCWYHTGLGSRSRSRPRSKPGTIKLGALFAS